MLLTLTDLSNESLQSQIARQIRVKILSGELDAEDPLPSIRGLAKEHKVSVVTVQRGYETLERDGLIHSRRGKGFFVSPIHGKTKKKMSRQRLVEKLTPPIKAALDEGLEKEDIVSAVESVLDKLTDRV